MTVRRLSKGWSAVGAMARFYRRSGDSTHPSKTIMYPGTRPEHEYVSMAEEIFEAEASSART
jgi:hypothetical protein